MGAAADVGSTVDLLAFDEGNPYVWFDQFSQEPLMGVVGPLIRGVDAASREQLSSCEWQIVPPQLGVPVGVCAAIYWVTSVTQGGAGDPCTARCPCRSRITGLRTGERAGRRLTTSVVLVSDSCPGERVKVSLSPVTGPVVHSSCCDHQIKQVRRDESGRGPGRRCEGARRK